MFVSYTARDEITYAIKTIASKRVSGELNDRNKITTKTIEKNFYFGDDVPPLDILIRTSGHTRLSDFYFGNVLLNVLLNFLMYYGQILDLLVSCQFYLNGVIIELFKLKKKLYVGKNLVFKKLSHRYC